MLSCPQCSSQSLYKAGLRYLPSGKGVQRYLCRECGYRFSSRQDSKGLSDINHNHQVGVILQDAKNLDTATETKTVAWEGRTSQRQDVKGRILQYLVFLKNQGYRESTLEQKNQLLFRLISLGADLSEPESVKRVIGSLQRSESYKALLTIAYDGFAKHNNITWIRPNYKQQERLPFIPHENEIDSLIAATDKKTSTLLQLLKETAMRLGEAWFLEWTDLNVQNSAVICNNPEKNSKPRSFRITPELTRMLTGLPKNNQFIFGYAGKNTVKAHRRLLRNQKNRIYRQRLRIAEKLKNPRILKITYHTLRHWKATQLYHKTRDILYVMKFLGHKDVRNTLLYIDLETACYPCGSEEYTGKVARTEAEAISLVESGFEYVCDLDGAKLFRRRK